jgi:hypothetical protein
MASYLVALINWEEDRIEEARRQLRAVRDGYLSLGADHPYALYTTRDLAELIDAMGKSDEADGVYAELIEHRTAALGADHPATLLAEDFRVGRLERGNRASDALSARQALLARQKRVLGPDAPQTLYSSYRLSALHRALNQRAEAKRLAQDALVTASNVLGGENPIVTELRTLVAEQDNGLPLTTRPVSITITAVEGLASMRTNAESKWEPAKVGTALLEAAELRTGPRGKIQFRIGPDQTLVVDRLTSLQVGKILKGEKPGTDLGIKYGKVRYDSQGGELLHQSTLRSPNATLSVRG